MSNDNPRDLDSSCEAPPEQSADTHEAVNHNAAKDIMADPSSAAGMPAKAAFLQAPPGTPEIVQKVLNTLPGLIGGVDEALRRETGQKEGFPFALVIWASEGMALHAANFNPALVKEALINFAESLSSMTPVASGEGAAVVDNIGDAVNDKPC